MELKEKTKLSSRTLDKHLDKMIDLQIIERKKDAESGNYPYPVYFKARPELVTYIKATTSRQELADGLEPALLETRDPLRILELIHAGSQVYFIELLTRIQQNRNITNEEIYFFGECFLWTNYKQYMSKLIEASRKIIDDVNIKQCLINQAKREIRVSTKTLEIYERAQEKDFS
jgi:hypothetical protein